MKIYTTLFIIAIIAFTACTKDPKDPKPKVAGLVTEEPSLQDFRIGEKWVWLEKSVAEGNIRWEGKEHQEVVAYQGTLGLWNGNDTVAVANTLGQEQSKTPYRSWPLKVGKTWSYESDWKNSEGTPMKTSMHVEVVSYGDEAVLAGRFKAYKIEYKGTITNAIGGSSEIHEIYWYAPELKVNMKKVQDDGYGSYVLELYDYKSGQSK